MITCSACLKEKDESHFSFRDASKNILHKHCKNCQKTKRKNSYLRNREHFLNYEKIHTPNRRKRTAEFIQQYKTNKPCSDCKKIYPPYVLDFDHLPQFKKEIKIGSEGLVYSKEKLLQEFAKCEIVCSNCHRERTWKRRHQLVVPPEVASGF